MLGFVNYWPLCAPNPEDSIKNANGVPVIVTHVINTKLPVHGVDIYRIGNHDPQVLISGDTLIFRESGHSVGWIKASEHADAVYVPPAEYPPRAELIQLVLNLDPREAYLATDVREEKRSAYLANGVIVLGALFRSQHLTLAKGTDQPTHAELLFWGEMFIEYDNALVIDGRSLLRSAERHAHNSERAEDARRIGELENTVRTLVARVAALECKFTTLAKDSITPVRDPESRPPSPCGGQISPRVFESVVFRKMLSRDIHPASGMDTLN